MRYTVKNLEKWPLEFQWPAKYKIWFIITVVVAIVLFLAIGFVSQGEDLNKPGKILLVLSIVVFFSGLIPLDKIMNFKSDYQNRLKILKALASGPKTMEEIDNVLNPDKPDLSAQIEKTMETLNQLSQQGLLMATNNNV